MCLELLRGFEPRLLPYEGSVLAIVTTEADLAPARFTCANNRERLTGLGAAGGIRTHDSLLGRQIL